MLVSTKLFETNSETDPESTKVIGGRPANHSAFRYLVSIQTYVPPSQQQSTRHVCGGVIISRYWIITAAHCFIYVKHKVLQAKAGAYRYKQEIHGNVQARVIVRRINHPRFRYSTSPFRIYHDISLVKVRDGFIFNTHIKPAILPSVNQQFSGTLLIAGWGNTAAKTVPYRYVLQTHLLPHNACKRPLQLFNMPIDMVNGKVCTLSSQGTVCFGDSGGGLVKSSGGGNYYLVGIISHNIRSCKVIHNNPTYYMDVRKYLGFIRRYSRTKLLSA